VIIVELINTSIEDLVNLINSDTHPIAKKIKDVMAAAVLFAALVAVIVGGVLFLPKILLLILNY
jgi:diacylglycerol kinase